MLALAFTFPGGRYHATPWGRHVNEGAVPWPPEPWRICRALIATWHHKVKPLAGNDDSVLNGLLEVLVSELPEYGLPRATHSHTRHYMPQYRTDQKNNTSLIFDAFMAVDKTARLTMSWPNVSLSDAETALLDDLLDKMTYLGRAESWVEATRLTEAPQVNCMQGTETVDTATGELKGETVTLFAPLPVESYQALRQQFAGGKGKIPKELQKTLPERCLDALAVETGDLRKQGWNQPPAARKVTYIRPVEALRPDRRVQTIKRKRATTAQFVVVGKPLPRVEDTLRIGEMARTAIMYRAKKAFGPDAIPAIFSGHGMPDDNRHQHAFYLPWDSDGDGRIDRLIVHVPAGMDHAQHKAVKKLRYLKDRKGGQWRTALEDIGQEVQSKLMDSATQWQTVTPWLHPWHVKKRFSMEDQIRRECRERGLPEPTNIEWFDKTIVGSTERRPIHFKRFRSKPVKHQPDRLGRFCRLTFPVDMQGPIALGFGCHFGLGLFRAIQVET
jgi:CRISPR-associated protein Csb2